MIGIIIIEAIVIIACICYILIRKPKEIVKPVTVYKEVISYVDKPCNDKTLEEITTLFIDAVNKAEGFSGQRLIKVSVESDGNIIYEREWK